MFRWILDKKGGWLALGAVALALFFAVNLGVAGLAGMRADLTEDRLYTLSAGTRNILAKLDKPVTLTLYYSDRLGTAAPVYGNYAARVKDMLRVFESASGGNLTFTLKNPKSFSETEDEAVELGMQGVPLDETGEKVYFGLTAASGDQKSSIAFLQIERENFLEYDITSLIHGIGSAKPVLAVYTARPMFGDFQMQMRGLPSRPWAVIDQLRGQFDVRHIFMLEEIWKEKPDILMIVHPGEFDDQDYYNLDQYMLRGGKALVFVDPFNETAAARQRGPYPERVASDLTRLLDHWGVELVEERVVADRQFARMVNAGDEKRIIPAPFLTWMGVSREGFSKDDAVTSRINLLNIQSAGIVRPKSTSTLTFEPLITSSPDSQEMDIELLRGARPKILTMLEQFKPSGKPLVLAARLNGRIKTMFPDGPPKEKEADKDKEQDETSEGKTSEAETSGDADAPGKTGPGASEGAGQPADTKADAADKAGSPAAPDASKAPKSAPEVKADKASRPSVPSAPTIPSGDGKPAESEPAAASEASEPAPEDGKPGATAAESADDPKAAAGATEPAASAATEKDAEKPKEEAPKAPPFIAESTAPMNVILVADADLLEDRFWVQKREFFGQQVLLPFANNADFVVNAVENLAGGDDLISLRSRGTAQRAFTKIEELRLAADREFRAEERRLQKKLQDAETKLAELENKKKEGGSEAAVDKAVEATTEKFTKELLATRKELRRVQLALREDIESLQAWLRFANIALIPILVGVAALVLGIVRSRRRRHAVEPQTG